MLQQVTCQVNAISVKHARHAVLSGRCMHLLFSSKTLWNQCQMHDELQTIHSTQKSVLEAAVHATA